MAQQSRMGEPASQHLRSFVKPPVKLQAVVEGVAEYVAVHGPTAEFRLRSGLEGRSQYPFLFLDDQYAPFYQCKLSEARARRSCVTVIPARPSEQIEACSIDEAQRHFQADTTNQSLSDEFVKCDDLHGVFNYTHGNGNDYHSRQTLPTLHNPDTWPSTATNIENNHSLSKPVNHDEFLETDSECVSLPISVDVQPYGVLQEVHMLDSLGTEMSGLNTYIIVSNSREEIGGSLETELFGPSKQVKDPDPIYRLRPDVSAVFRARHDRLLPVGFSLGAEVQLLDKITSGVVVRRTVQGRQRLYDVKEENGAIHKDLAEEHLQLHQGGTFGFRLPHQI